MTSNIDNNEFEYEDESTQSSVQEQSGISNFVIMNISQKRHFIINLIMCVFMMIVIHACIRIHEFYYI